MILYNLLAKNEQHPIYKDLEVSNCIRHYDFLKSIVETAMASEQKFLSQTVLKALNYHAIACLHTSAGEYRPCKIFVGDKDIFPDHWNIPDIMDDFINVVNSNWQISDTLSLAAYVLWRINRIHPFINGNGRTARAACLFVICVKSGGWLPMSPLLPELIRKQRPRYIEILQQIDASEAAGNTELEPLIDFLGDLISRQMTP